MRRFQGRWPGRVRRAGRDSSVRRTGPASRSIVSVLILFAGWILVGVSGTSAASGTSGTSAWPITMPGQLDNTTYPLTTPKGTLLTESQLPAPASYGQVDLQSISSAGQIKGHFATSVGTQPLEGPVVTDSKGNVYVESVGTDNGSHIESFNQRGKFRWISSNFQFGVYHLALGWNGVLYVAGAGSNVEVLGLDEATGTQSYSPFAVGFSTDLFAYAGGLIAFTNGYEACYYSYTGVPSATGCIDGGNAVNGGIGYSADSGGNGVVFIAGHAGPSQDCQAPVSVEKITSSGILWTWTAPPLQPIGCGTWLTATPDGGVIVKSYQGDIASISPSGTTEWIDTLDCSSDGGAVVDSSGNVAIPYDCGNGTVGVNFATQDSQVSPYSNVVLSSSCAANQYYSLDSNDPADVGSDQLYLGYNNEPGCSSGDHTNGHLMNAFSEPGLSQNEWLALNVPGVATGFAPPVYAALGDSYSSGEGNPPFSMATPGCDQSLSGAWAELLSVPLDSMLACSGATTSALSSSYQSQPPQLESLKSLNPGLVTITIGGNDIGFSSILERCWDWIFYNCATDATFGNASANITALGSSIVSVYQSLRTAAPSATILVVGYPRLFPTSQAVTTGCGWLSNAKRSGLNRLASQLNGQLAQAAAQAGVDYVSTLNVLKGHELCTPDSWVNSVLPDPGAAHPNLMGQQAIATAVNKKLSKLRI